MAPGIAAVFSAAGHPVRLWARRPEAARTAVEQAVGFGEFLAEEGLAAPERSNPVTMDDLSGAVCGADLVVEAVSEDPTVKRDLYGLVEEHLRSGAVLASTTSGLDPDLLSAELDRPEGFVVMHFWNPAHLIALVEVLGGSRTAPGVVEAACALIRSIGRYPVRLDKFVPGFLGVRLQQAVVREAIALLSAGVASAADIDAATRLSFGARFPVMGPLETSDLGGLDVVAAIHDYLLADLDASDRPQPELRRLVESGDLGTKTGRGFYDWSNRDAEDLIRRRDAELVGRLRALGGGGVGPAHG